ncbi:MAG: sigma-54-dependent Fis family transcriptional regulator [Candidatus Eisenbacteria bacterium]|uniref:Sigma-54-dependent Fis family transcriptional regulator n=1 Tax=Eiseniibacteriota bacterium TaxID=2212470 RepID=A0A538UD76_UNCEI|nr:MAG: sigma-54-dependent Fis family transcriptional regulator [Candidatus Eisenbacteria bacterium]
MERRMKEEPRRECATAELLGESPVWREVCSTLLRVAESDLPVLVLGETGSGKELVAREVHRLSTRSTRAFVAHNCGATPDTLIESELFGHARGAFTGAVADRNGLFDEADRGTLFLDEIGDASGLLQMKLLRVLQEGEARRVGDTRVRRLDVRVISATHRGLEDAVAVGGFRADLYYRLNAVRLRLPPLRERGHDVLVLARHFIARAAAACGIDAPAIAPELAQRLLGYRWPGNVRELANGCAYAVRVAGARVQVAVAHWPETPWEPDAVAASGLHAETRALEERRLREALERTRWNKSRAARALGLSRQGLLKKLRRYGLVDATPGASALDGPAGGP